MRKLQTLSFIGLGVMGEPMCRHLTTKSGLPVAIYDISAEPVARLAETGAVPAPSVEDAARHGNVIFLSLPSGKHLQAVCEGEGGLLASVREGQTIVDLGTSPVDLSRALAGRFAAKGVDYADAPVARTRQAAEQGTLAITVGASEAVFACIEPLLRCFASEVTHCGAVGAGQVVKILNNMVVVGTVTALCEAAAIARSAGVEAGPLFETFMKGSADSFALRNHGLKSVAPRLFPQRTFPTEYMLKDISYALDMAAAGGVRAREAELTASLLQEAVEQGYGADYWPVIMKLIEVQEARPAE
ncbi:hypothetical protein SAMN02745194_02163 [Roseomonas rosea]|uniref:3-hydroxyisobutyrate dehydrogenase n=1 Tax=Muricoccus roseus TaxID=198092 RepID=A0A1M6I0V5_9PROT|nr:NAD(P)-dependent oxidoreductase [Roseomonas rosea]SHJ28035.1 hypothetical protein SAMN02745194_02163 [Roseomonas rosea]